MSQTVDITNVVLMVTFYNWTITYLKPSVIYQPCIHETNKNYHYRIITTQNNQNYQLLPIPSHYKSMFRPLVLDTIIFVVERLTSRPHVLQYSSICDAYTRALFSRANWTLPLSAKAVIRQFTCFWNPPCLAFGLISPSTCMKVRTTFS